MASNTPTPGVSRTDVAARGTVSPQPGTEALVKVSLLGVVDLLPAELKPAKAVGDVATVQLSIPLSLVAGQLSSGSVRIPFGELKRLAPAGFFTLAGSDAKDIVLPLKEILPQIQGSLFGRREGQKAVYVPEDVTNVFSARGTTVAPTNQPSGFAASVPTSKAPATPTLSGPGAPKAGAQAPRANPATGSTTQYFKKPTSGPTGAANLAGAAKTAAQPGGSFSQAPASPAAPKIPPPSPPSPPSSMPAQPAVPAVGGHATASPAKPIAAPNLLAAMQGGGVPAPKSAPSPSAIKPKAPAPGAPAVANAGGIPVSARSAAPSKPALAAVPPPVDDGRTLSVTLAQVSAAWPDAVKAEIAQWDLSAASLTFAVSQVEAALRQGRVSQTWQEVIEHLDNDAGTGKSSGVGDTALDFPLSVMAPAYLGARQSAATARTSALVDATIPDLFQAGKSEATPQSSPAAAPASTSAPSQKAAAKSAGAAGTPSAPAKPSPAGVADKPAPAAPLPPPVDPHAGEFLSIPLAMVDESWLDAIKSEIAKSKISGLKLSLPYEEVSRGLKAGKLEYPWKQIRAWIQPALPPTLGSEHSEKPVTLPLKVVAPMFLGHFKPAKGGKKNQIAQDIPDLFSGGAATVPEIPPSPAPAASAPAPTAPVDPTGGTPATTPAGSYSTTQFFRKPPTDIGELFGQPGKRQWSPQEIVQGTSRIRGVAGAVIAMQDGLLVAAHLQSPWRPEATAAFLPQIYSRLNQYLRELNTGDLANVTLSTPSGKLLVYSSGIIYFAVVIKPEESVPTAAIELIVMELGRHSK